MNQVFDESLQIIQLRIIHDGNGEAIIHQLHVLFLHGLSRQSQDAEGPDLTGLLSR